MIQPLLIGIAVVSFFSATLYLFQPLSDTDYGLYKNGVLFAYVGVISLYLLYYLKYKRGNSLLREMAVEDMNVAYEKYFYTTAIIIIPVLLGGSLLASANSFITSFGGATDKDNFETLIFYLGSLFFAAIQYVFFIDYGRGVHKLFLKKNVILLVIIALCIYLPYRFIMSNVLYYIYN